MVRIVNIGISRSWLSSSTFASVGWWWIHLSALNNNFLKVEKCSSLFPGSPNSPAFVTSTSGSLRSQLKGGRHNRAKVPDSQQSRPSLLRPLGGPQANIEPGASPHALLCFPAAVLEYSDQKQLVGKRIYLLTGYRLSSRDAKTGIQSKNLEPESGAETTEEHCLLACFLWPAQLPFIRSPIPPA